MKRPPIDRKMSTRAQAMDTALLDLVEALESLYETTAVLDEMGRPQGQRAPADEALSLEGLWRLQEHIHKELVQARSSLVGLARATEKVTG